MTRVFYMVCMIAVVSCGDGGKQAEILPPTKMENVIWDVVQADEYIQNYVLKDSNKINVNAERYKLYQRVFRMHNTTREQFEKSYDYYAAHPGLNKKIFDSLSSRASKRMQESFKNMTAQ